MQDLGCKLGSWQDDYAEKDLEESQEVVDKMRLILCTTYLTLFEVLTLPVHTAATRAALGAAVCTGLRRAALGAAAPIPAPRDH